MKFIKLLITLWLSMMYLSPATAQISIGLQGGYGQNKLESSLAYYAFAQYKPVNDYSFGIPLIYKFNSWMSIQTDLSIIRKSYKLERSGFLEGISQTTSNSYLQMPIMAHFSFGGTRLKGFTNLGLYTAFWYKSKIKGVQSSIFYKDPSFDNILVDYHLDQSDALTYDERYAFDKLRDRRLEHGWVAGAGIAYVLPSFGQVLVEGRYYYSLTDMQKDYMVGQMPRYNQTYIVQVGLIKNLKW
ncbi:MAG: PorT family protein [Pedobacter sp.]|nr:MAG: PorT family protein [Pedobacter sp.]